MEENMTNTRYTVNGIATESHRDRNTHMVVSTVAFLLGVPERFFENDEGFKKSIYDTLKKDTRARIIRNLCMLRTAIERGFSDINHKITYEYKSLISLPGLVPQECLTELSEDGVSINYTNYSLNRIIIEMNRNIANRINNCKELFPLWLKWEYLRNIFIMPNGLTETGIRDAASIYYANKNFYPYRVYMNWKPTDEGNILYNDEKFVKLLYKWNNDEFTDTSKVTDAGSYTKGNIYDFIRQSQNTVLVVDCENSDPYKLCATLQNLKPDMLQKITKVILYDDIHAASAWDILKAYIRVPVEHNRIARIKQNKSLVDIRLTAGTCREFYENKVDSFVLVSSDSDYWGLITSMPEAKFLVMVEYDKCGPNIKSALLEKGIFYCYIDDFYSGDCEDIKITALLRETNRRLEQAIQMNLHELMDKTLDTTRIELSDSEKKRIYNQYFKAVQLDIGNDGTIRMRVVRKP